MASEETLSQLVTKLKKLRVKKDKITSQKTEVEKEYAILQREVLDRMEFEDTGSIKVGGTNFTRVKRTGFTIVDEDKFIKWAKSRDEQLVFTAPRKKLVNDEIKKMLDDDEPLAQTGIMPDVIEYVRMG